MVRVRGEVIAAALLLAGCGHHFPLGEKLAPFTYGPPYGAALRENIPHHPHNPAPGEREAEPEATANRTFKSYDRCRIGLAEELGRRDAGASAVDISAREAVGHAEQGGVIHEYRCVGPVLSYRVWHREGGDAAAHGADGGGEEHP